MSWTLLSYSKTFTETIESILFQSANVKIPAAQHRIRTARAWPGWWEHRGLWEVLLQIWSQYKLDGYIKRLNVLLRIPPPGKWTVLLPSEKQHRSIKTRRTRLKNSFIPRPAKSISPPADMYYIAADKFFFLHIFILILFCLCVKHYAFCSRELLTKCYVNASWMSLVHVE